MPKIREEGMYSLVVMLGRLSETEARVYSIIFQSGVIWNPESESLNGTGIGSAGLLRGR